MTAEKRLELMRLFHQLDEEADLRNADCEVRVLFQDGEQNDLHLVSLTHLELNGTVIAVPLLPDGTESATGGIQFLLEDVQKVYNYKSKQCIFSADSSLNQL